MGCACLLKPRQSGSQSRRLAAELLAFSFQKVLLDTSLLPRAWARSIFVVQPDSQRLAVSKLLRAVSRSYSKETGGSIDILGPFRLV